MGVTKEVREREMSEKEMLDLEIKARHEIISKWISQIGRYLRFYYRGIRVSPDVGNNERYGTGLGGLAALVFAPLACDSSIPRMNGRHSFH